MPTVVPTLRSHVVFDSVCMHSGRYVFAEVQQSPGAKGYLAKREEFYRAVAIVNQQGRDFSGDDYGAMAESVFFWIVVSPRKADRGTVRRSSFGSSMSLSAEIVEINICHPDEVEGDDHLRFFCTLFYPFIGFEDRKRRLKEEFNFEFDESMDDCLKEMSHMGYQDEVLSGLLMTERCEGIDEGMEKGRAEGLEAGMEKGRAEEVLDYVRTVRGMRAKGLSLDDAMGLVPERIAEDVRSALVESILLESNFRRHPSGTLESRISLNAWRLATGFSNRTSISVDAIFFLILSDDGPSNATYKGITIVLSTPWLLRLPTASSTGVPYLSAHHSAFHPAFRSPSA